MNEKNEWDQNVKAKLVEGPVESVSREEVVKAIREMMAGEAAGPSEVSCVRVCWMEEKYRMIGR